MDPFSIEVKNSAVKFLKKQSAETQKRLKSKIETVAANPYDSTHSKWLAGHNDMRSSRVGALRIIFEVNATARILTVVTIDGRGQVYSRL